MCLYKHYTCSKLTMSITHRYYVHPDDVGFVVGRQGRTIKSIETRTGSRIQLCNKPTPEQMEKNSNLRPYPFFFIQTHAPFMVSVITDMIERIAKESENRRNGVFHEGAKTRPPPSGIRCLRGAENTPFIVEFSDSEYSEDSEDSEDS